MEMLDLARFESWNKDDSLCCLLCPGFLPGRIWEWGEMWRGGGGFFPPRFRLLFCAHSTAPSHQTLQMALVLPCPALAFQLIV